MAYHPTRWHSSLLDQNIIPKFCMLTEQQLDETGGRSIRMCVHACIHTRVRAAGNATATTYWFLPYVRQTRNQMQALTFTSEISQILCTGDFGYKIKITNCHTTLDIETI
jgi:hypothetical protein